MSLQGLKVRTTVIQQLRAILTTKGFEEIEPQYFSHADTLEPTIYPFKTNGFYLPTSPELFLKQAMAAGAGNCFAVSHAFRNLEGRGKLHNPEFVMAEWYQQHADYHDMMELTEAIISELINLPRFSTLSWIDLWQKINLDLNALIDDEAMIACAQSRGYNPDNATWEQLFNQIADNELVPLFPITPFFLIDYPAKISPLAKPRQDNPNFAERFELFVNHIELANGNTENFDSSTISAVMRQEQAMRPQESINRPFLTALETLSGQQWAGVGLGIDRVAMLLGSYQHIDEVQAIAGRSIPQNV